MATGPPPPGGGGGGGGGPPLLRRRGLSPIRTIRMDFLETSRSMGAKTRDSAVPTQAQLRSHRRPLAGKKPALFHFKGLRERRQCESRGSAPAAIDKEKCDAYPRIASLRACHFETPTMRVHHFR